MAKYILFNFTIDMKIDLYNQNKKVFFCGNSNYKKFLPQTNFNDSSLVRIHLEDHKGSYYEPIIPDLFKYIKETGKVKIEDIKGIVDYGGLSVIFDLGDDVLKASLENPLEFRVHNSAIDIPFLSPVEKYGKTYFVREAKADIGHVSRKDCCNVIKRLRKFGLEPSCDLNIYKTWQVGLFQGKPYLLDTRCARPRPNRFSRFIYDFRKFNTGVIRILRANAEAIAKRDEQIKKRVALFGPRILHLDETPRPNLSFKRGVAIIRGVMDRNKNAGLPALSMRAVFTCIKRAICNK